MSVGRTAPASVHRIEGKVLTAVVEGTLADMVQRFLARPDAGRHHLALCQGDEEPRFDAARALHAQDVFVGAC